MLDLRFDNGNPENTITVAWKYPIDAIETREILSKRKTKREKDNDDAHPAYAFDLKDKTILVTGASPNNADYEKLIERYHGHYLNYDKHSPDTYDLTAKVLKADMVISAIGLTSHAQFYASKDAAKAQDKPFDVMTSLGRGGLFRSIERVFAKEGWEVERIGD
jgi:hypothetical protein